MIPPHSSLLRPRSVLTVTGLVSFGLVAAIDIKSNFEATLVTVDSAGKNPSVAYALSGTEVYGHYTANEYGDQITLQPGTGRILTKFTFDYYANYSQVGGLNLRFYANDGPLISGVASPGTLLGSYTLDVSNFGATLSVVLPFSQENLVPSTLTYAVRFTGFDASQNRFSTLTAPNASATVGSGNDQTFWERTPTNGWARATLSSVPPSYASLTNLVVTPATDVARITFSIAGGEPPFVVEASADVDGGWTQWLSTTDRSVTKTIPPADSRFFRVRR